MKLIAIVNYFRRDRRGSVLVEIAMSTPIIIGMVMGGFELARFSLVHQKMNRVASVMGDLITRSERLNEGDFINAFQAVPFISDPFALGNDGVVILTYVEGAEDGGNDVLWQRLGAGALSAASEVGMVGSIGTLPNGRALAPGEGVVVAEVFYEFTPLLFDDVIEPRRVRHTAMLRPRYGALSTIEP